MRDDVPTVDAIGSDKVCFAGCDLVISKLEPYLGKIIMEPDAGWLGSTEWVGLSVTTDIPLIVVAYLLMAPSLCEAYRRLQSGKRHARFDPREFLNLKVQLPSMGARHRSWN
jgi:type I restriction enzyme M protein